MIDEYRYGVRVPDADGGPYGDTEWFDTWAEAKASAEVVGAKLGEVVYVDEERGYEEGLVWNGRVERVRESELTDFYAEFFEGDWMIENDTRGVDG